MLAEDERLACEDGFGRVLATGGKKGFSDHDDIRMGGPGGEFAGGIDDKDVFFLSFGWLECSAEDGVETGFRERFKNLGTPLGMAGDDDWESLWICCKKLTLWY